MASTRLRPCRPTFTVRAIILIPNDRMFCLRYCGVSSQRLQNRLHDMQSRVDPLLTLRDARGATVASADNALAGDPHAIAAVLAP